MYHKTKAREFGLAVEMVSYLNLQVEEKPSTFTVYLLPYLIT